MRTAPRREVGLAVLLSGLAGYLDVIGFIVLGGQFVSFMSGNTTELATFLGTGYRAGVGTVTVLLGTFVAGVVIGAVAARFGDSRTTVLVVTSSLLIATATAASVADVRTAVMVGLPAAMGAVNATFLRQGEVSIGLTYMTGTLVKAGQQLVDAFTGGARWLWFRSLSLWFALAVGGFVGAVVHRLTGPEIALWIAVAVIIAITVGTVTVRVRAGVFGRPPRSRSVRETAVIGDDSVDDRNS